MGRRLTIVLLAVVALAAAYTGASWAIGQSVQGQLQHEQQQLLGDNGYLVPVSSQYRRGVFESDERITYRLGEPLARLLRRGPAGQRWAGLQLLLRQRIYHGPLAQGRTLALARIDSELLLLDPAAGKGAAPPLAGTPVLQADTQLGWRDDIRTQLRSAPWQYRAADGRTLSWQGLHGSVSADRRQGHTSLSLTAPGLSLQSPLGQLQLSGFELQSDLQRAFDTLHVGQMQMSLSRLQLSEPGGVAATIQGLKFQNASAVNGDYIDQSGQMSADAVQFAQFSATRIGYVLSATHLHGPSLAALAGALRDARRQAVGPAVQPAAVLAAFRQYGLQMVLHAPVLTISRAGFATPDGQLRLSAKLALSGPAPQQLAPGPVGLALLARYLDVTADLSVDRALLERMLAGSARQALYTAQIQQLVQQGYLRQQSGSLRCHLSYRDGRLLINDLPFPPQPATP